MDQELRCPLCSSTDVEKVEEISLSLLKEVWAKSIKIDIDYLLPNQNYITKLKCKKCSLGYFYPFVLGDGEFYSKLSQDKMYYEHSDKTEYLLCKSKVFSGTKVLDIGAGSGELTKFLPSGVKYTGLEFNQSAIQIAKSLGRNVTSRSFEDLDTDGESGSYDYICIFQVLEHLDDVNTFLKKVLSLLKVGGRVLIAVPNNDSFLSVAPNNLLNLPPHHNLLWNENSLRVLAQNHGLEVLDVVRESVTNVHKSWYSDIKGYSILSKLFNRKHKSLRRDLMSRIVIKLGHYIGKLYLLQNLKSEDGHTIFVELVKTK